MRLFPVLPLIFIAAYIFVAISITLDYKNNDYAALNRHYCNGSIYRVVFLLAQLKKST